MKVGMLWMDDDKTRTLEEKVQRAADYYAQKYRRRPQQCFVNPSLLQDEIVVDGVQVRPSAHVLPYHFWIGMKEEQAGAVVAAD